MKTDPFKMALPFAVLLISIMSFTSCDPKNMDEPISRYKPVLMKRADMQDAIKMAEPRIIENVGKIYSYNKFLLINEKFKGVHVFDNTDPTNPENIGFIQIPGNVEVSIKNNYLYANSAVDLITLQFHGNEVTEIDRKIDAFDELVPPDRGLIPSEYASYKDQDLIIVNWTI